MKEAVFTHWTFPRFLRLIIGLAILVQAFISKDTLFGLAGLLLTSMALFNMSCCGPGGCSATPAKKHENSTNITYEEVV